VYVHTWYPVFSFLLLKRLIFCQKVRSCSSTVPLCLPVEKLVSLLFNHITYIKSMTCRFLRIFFFLNSWCNSFSFPTLITPVEQRKTTEKFCWCLYCIWLCVYFFVDYFMMMLVSAPRLYLTEWLGINKWYSVSNIRVLYYFFWVIAQNK